MYSVYTELTNINNYMNKYEKWYAYITENAKNRLLSGYTERHHIVPRSLGGKDDITNLVNLTAREHFICHWLLTKIYTGTDRGKMVNALYIMQGKNKYQERYNTKITSRVYKVLREEYAEYISKQNKGRVQPLEEKEKQINAMTGRKREPFSEEWRAKLSASGSGENNSMYGKSHKESSLQLMREKAIGRKQSEETIKKKADAIRGSKREKRLCPHCNQHIAVNGYARYHGDRCKSLLLT